MKTFYFLSSGLVPPRIVASDGTTVNEGDSFRLTCDHSGSDPVTLVYWLVNGSVVTNDQSSQLQVPFTDTLQFTNISRNYSGEYNCTIQDDRGDTISSAETIVIQCRSSSSVVRGVEGVRRQGGRRGGREEGGAEREREGRGERERVLRRTED